VIRPVRLPASLAVSALLLACASSGVAAGGASIVGTWTGVLMQSGMPNFRVTATIRSLRVGEDDNTVRYSGLDCRGTWMFRGRSGSTYRFLETITAGRSATCKGTGIVSLRVVVGGKLAYVFRGGGVESHGTLTRIRRS
jgi:hypothetical protein